MYTSSPCSMPVVSENRIFYSRFTTADGRTHVKRHAIEIFSCSLAQNIWCDRCYVATFWSLLLFWGDIVRKKKQITYAYTWRAKTHRHEIRRKSLRLLARRKGVLCVQLKRGLFLSLCLSWQSHRTILLLSLLSARVSVSSVPEPIKTVGPRRGVRPTTERLHAPGTHNAYGAAVI